MVVILTVVFRAVLGWLGVGLMAFFAALFVDVLRGEEVGIAYISLHRKAALILVLAWPYAIPLVLIEYARGGGQG